MFTMPISYAMKAARTRPAPARLARFLFSPALGYNPEKFVAILKIRVQKPIMIATRNA